MPRPIRLDFPAVPQHVIVRGIDRHACFRADNDYRSYLDDLSRSASAEACAVHAYVLMTNHVHLLVTGERAGCVSRLMQCVGRRYVRRFNASWRRTGSLFEGRFRASLVETERYLLTCMRYIELNPVRAGMVRRPFDYRWSSVHANADLHPDPVVTPHGEYVRLGGTEAERAGNYRAMLGEHLQKTDIERIREYVNRDCVLGTRAFQDDMERACGRRTRPARGPFRTPIHKPYAGSVDDLG